MTVKYHINKDGGVSVCRATKGNCPFGGSENHYSSKEEAQKVVDKINEENHGIIGGLKCKGTPTKKANTPETKKELRERIEEMEERENTFLNKSYFKKCYKSVKLHNYEPSNKETAHYSDDRQTKERMMGEMFGEGNLIGHYKVLHDVNKNGRVKAKNQIIGIYDTGQIKIYDVEHGGLVTTFIPHKARVETMLVKAGEIPDKAWLDKVQENKEALDIKWDEAMEGTGEKKNSQFNRPPKLKSDVGTPKTSEFTEKKLPPIEDVKSKVDILPKIDADKPKKEHKKPKSSKPKKKAEATPSFKKDIVSEFFKKNRTKGRKKYY